MAGGSVRIRGKEEVIIARDMWKCREQEAGENVKSREQELVYVAGCSTLLNNVLKIRMDF